MACDLMDCCQFFSDNMKDLPKAAEYIRARLCLADYQLCSRFQIYKEYGAAPPSPYLNAADAEIVKKALKCLQKKLGTERKELG